MGCGPRGLSNDGAGADGAGAPAGGRSTSATSATSPPASAASRAGSTRASQDAIKTTLPDGGMTVRRLRVAYGTILAGGVVLRIGEEGVAASRGTEEVDRAVIVDRRGGLGA